MTMTPDEIKTVADKVREMCIFCIERQGRCWKGWNAAKVFRYLAWNFLNGTLFVTYEGAKIKALAVALRVSTKDLPPLATDCRLFDWMRLHLEGNCTYICQVFGERKYCKDLQQQIINKWPEAKTQPFMTYRNDKLHQIPEWRFCV